MYMLNLTILIEVAYLFLKEIKALKDGPHNGKTQASELDADLVLPVTFLCDLPSHTERKHIA